jgi:hypothetical protein
MSKDKGYSKFLKRLYSKFKVAYTEEDMFVINVTDDLNYLKRKIKRCLYKYPLKITEIEQEYQEDYTRKYIVLQYLKSEIPDFSQEALYKKYKYKLKQFTVDTITSNCIVLKKEKSSDYSKTIRYFKNEPFLIINDKKAVILYNYEKEQIEDILETLEIKSKNISNIYRYKHKIRMKKFKSLPKELYEIINSLLK